MSNPFEDGPDGGNQTEQMRAIGADPRKAFAQMIDAGWHPRDWGIDPEKHGVTINDKWTTGQWKDEFQ